MKAAIAIESYITKSYFILLYGFSIPPLYPDTNNSSFNNIINNAGKSVVNVSEKPQKNTITAKNNITKMLLEKG